MTPQPAPQPAPRARRLAIVATAALGLLAGGCAAPATEPEPGTPRLLSPAEIQAAVERAAAATPARASAETRAAGLRARAAALRQMPDPVRTDSELMRRARALGAEGL